MMFLAVFFGCAVGWSLMGVVRSVFEHHREHRRGRASVSARHPRHPSRWNCTMCTYEVSNKAWKDYIA